MKTMKVVEKLYFWNFGIVNFWFIIHPKLRNVQEKVQSFNEAQSLRLLRYFLKKLSMDTQLINYATNFCQDSKFV
jgi:hypothetical protein